MDKLLYEKIVDLKRGIEEDERVLYLLEMEKKLSNDPLAMKLAYQKDIKAMEYEDALKHFKEDSKEVEAAQKALYLAKKELDSLEIVKEYNKAYQAVRLLYEDINKELFSEFKNKHSC